MKVHVMNVKEKQQERELELKLIIANVLLIILIKSTQPGMILKMIVLLIVHTNVKHVRLDPKETLIFV